MSYSDKSTDVQKLITSIYNWGLETFGEYHQNPVLALKLKEEVDELHTELSRLNHIKVETFKKEYLEDVEGSDEYIDKQIKLLKENIKAELADVFIVFASVLSDNQLTFEELIKLVNQKMEINKLRRWNKPDTNGIIKHKKQ